MDIDLDTLQDALTIGETKLVAEVLVRVGQTVLSGTPVKVQSRKYPGTLHDFADYQDWLNLHFREVLRA